MTESEDKLKSIASTDFPTVHVSSSLPACIAKSCLILNLLRADGTSDVRTVFFSNLASCLCSLTQIK